MVTTKHFSFSKEIRSLKDAEYVYANVKMFKIYINLWIKQRIYYEREKILLFVHVVPDPTMCFFSEINNFPFTSTDNATETC